MASVAILAGGRATRYGGQDKGALVVGGRSILERQLSEVARVTDDVLIVTGAEVRSAAHGLGAAGSGFSRIVPDAGSGGPSGVEGVRTVYGTRVRVVRDRVSDSGPLAGLDAALSAARDDALVVVAGDMPFVTAELLQYLLSLAAGTDVVVPRTERGYHPLCAVYTRTCRAAVRARLDAQRLKMIDFLESVRVRVVATDELDALGDRHRLLANVNTPAEYEAIRALAGHEL